MAADPDAGMETCPSPEIGDSRKRPLDSDTENGTTKRSHFSSGKLMILHTHIYHISHVSLFCIRQCIDLNEKDLKRNGKIRTAEKKQLKLRTN